MHYRFIFEIYPIIVCLGAIGLLDWIRRFWVPSFIVVMLVIASSTTIPLLEQKFGMQSLSEMDRYAREGTLVGQRLGTTLPQNTIVATTLVGTISYYSKLPIIDQWGLNDRAVAHQPNHPIITRGHVKFASIDYLQSRRVNLYMAHPQICSCSNLCIENLPNVFIRLHDDECVRTWYLVQKPELTSYFCAHPNDFLLHNVNCKPF